MPDLEYDRTQTATAPANRAKLFRIVILLVDKISLIEDLPGFFETDSVSMPDLSVFPSVEVEAYIRVIPRTKTPIRGSPSCPPLLISKASRIPPVAPLIPVDPGYSQTECLPPPAPRLRLNFAPRAKK
jgi:hypothetical protein